MATNVAIYTRRPVSLLSDLTLPQCLLCASSLPCGPDGRSPSHQIHLIRFMIALVFLALCLWVIHIGFIPELCFTRPPWFLGPRLCGCICRCLSGVPAGTLLAAWCGQFTQQTRAMLWAQWALPTVSATDYARYI